ncbi:hypothetical protein [Streptomyces noursei]|uniref:hypothetical protein n=1 Tax=Streptomyces noursei TaxID=1971 RepID=UPI0023B7E5AF|nr:hypothetical protein [Streptomyces noursei]
MPKKQSTAAQRARQAARQGGKYTRALRSTASDENTTEPDNHVPRCAIQPCHPKLPLDSLVNPGDGRDPFPACELHAAWLLAALPGATIKASPTPGSPPATASTSTWCGAWPGA